MMTNNKKKVKRLNVQTVGAVIFIAVVCFIMYIAIPTPLLGTEAKKPPEANRMKPDHAPTPFSAAEIRDGCHPGRMTKYRIQVAGKPVVYNVSTFVNGDQKGTGFEAVTLDAEGKQIGEKQSARAKWEELQAHASFPEKQTKITTEKYTTPVGTFECWLYVVSSEKEGKKEVKRFWFAKTLPGPPVCYEQTVDGALAFRMTLMENKSSASQ